MGGGMQKENLLIILPFPEDRSITDRIREKFPYIDVQYHHLMRTNFPFKTDQGLPKDLFKDTTILVTFGSFPSNPEDAPNLNLIHLLSAGVDHFVSHPLFTQTDIPITTSSGIHGPAISEWALMSTLVFSKNYKKMYELQKEHKWGRPRQDFPDPTDWVGKKVGIAGYGGIGRQIARVFTSLGCHIYAYTASPRSTPTSRSSHGYHVPHLGDPDGSLPLAWYSGTTKPDLHTFLSQDLDILVISLPLTPQTRGMFGHDEWDILSRRDAPSSTPGPKPGAFLINISRGPILHQPALVSALRSQKLAGAALDVTDPEPLPPDSELWEMENVVLTPHISGLTTRYLERAIGGVLVENLGRRERGEGLVNLVERRRGY